MAPSLEGRRILVTGAAGGVGRATAALFRAEGARLALLDRHVAGVEAVAHETDAWASACDLASAGSIADAVAAAGKALGGIDGVVNAAGVLIVAPFEETTAEMFSTMLSVNLLGIFHLVQAALPMLRAAEAATIVNIASISALVPHPGTACYSATKAAVIMLTKSLAFELGPTIRVNAICPGTIRTEMTRHIWSEDVRRQDAERRVALKRIGSSEDVASGALFLSGPASAFMTGTELVMDGGFTWR